MPVSEHFKSLKVGQVGTVTNPSTGLRWAGDYYLEALSSAGRDGSPECVRVASVRRLGGSVGKISAPAERASGIPASWFAPHVPERLFTS
jgi:hypothetical protein